VGIVRWDSRTVSCLQWLPAHARIHIKDTHRDRRYLSLPAIREISTLSCCCAALRPISSSVAITSDPGFWCRRCGDQGPPWRHAECDRERKRTVGTYSVPLGGLCHAAPTRSGSLGWRSLDHRCSHRLFLCPGGQWLRHGQPPAGCQFHCDRVSWKPVAYLGSNRWRRFGSNRMLAGCETTLGAGDGGRRILTHAGTCYTHHLGDRQR
jgi:hypothetical protein